MQDVPPRLAGLAHHALVAFTIISVAALLGPHMFFSPARSALRPVGSSGTAPRDPYQEPFANTSIWNMPIGSSATYVNSGFTDLATTYSSTQFFQAPQIDENIIVLEPTAPLTNIETNNVGWGAGDRCVDQGATLATVPIPNAFTIPDSNENNAAAVLKADGRTIYQNQPFTRCTAGSFATSLSTTSFPDVDLYGSGESGSHGGSKLSALGGSIRLGELRPGQQGPPHAVKLMVDSEVFLYNCSVSSDCFRWPATVADSGATSTYGTVNNNTTTAAKMGALLAIPASVNINAISLETDPGKQMAWTMQNYGGYIADSSGSGQGMAFMAENGPDGTKNAEFLADYGMPMHQHVSGQSISEGWTAPTFGADTAWSRDVRRIWLQLKIVDNNTSSSIGGGGTPRLSLKQPISP